MPRARAAERGMTLHLIRTDVLLYALEGFAEVRDHPYRAAGCSLTDWQIRGVACLALSKPRLGRGEGVEAARRLLLGPVSLKTMLCDVRQGRMPRYWQHVLRDRELTT